MPATAAETELPKLDPGQLVQEIREKAYAALASQISKMDVSAFTRKVIEDLDKQRSAVVWQLLGLDDQWGKWEVDHCNGRDSKITQYLAAEADAAVREWVNGAVMDALKVEGDKIRAKARGAIRQEVSRRLERLMREEISRQVESRVKTTVTELVKETMDEIIGGED